MLELLTIKDFQAHRHLSIKLDPAITTVVGPSDVGKSAVIRALTWLATNQPLGSAFIREGQDAAQVTLMVDGRKVVRSRGKSLNTYSLDGEELRSFGNNVPDEIFSLLNLSPINFQCQHDSPFWFCESAGEVSRQLNRIVDLEIIDRTLANLDKANRAAAADTKAVERQLETAKASRSSLAWAKKAHEALLRVEGRERTHKSATETRLILAERVSATILHTATVRTLRAHHKTAFSTYRLGVLAEETGSRANLLRSLIRDMRESLIRQQKPIPDLSSLIQLEETARKATSQADRLRDVIESAQETQDQAKRTAREAKVTEEQYHKMIGKECPLCGTKL